MTINLKTFLSITKLQIYFETFKIVTCQPFKNSISVNRMHYYLNMVPMCEGCLMYFVIVSSK